MLDLLVGVDHAIVTFPMVRSVVFVRLLVILQSCRLVAGDYAVVPSFALDFHCSAPYTTRPGQKKLNYDSFASSKVDVP